MVKWNIVYYKFGFDKFSQTLYCVLMAGPLNIHLMLWLFIHLIFNFILRNLLT